MQQQDIFPTLHTPARTLRAGTPTPASIEKKEQQAVRLIRSFAKNGSLKIAYSGGKDGQQKYEQTFHGLFPAPNAKRFLEDYFQIDL